MNRPTIVIADDDRDLVELLTLRCRGVGFTVETAGDAISALVKIERSKPSIVILDVNMPSGGGLNLREMMADNPALAKIPVVIITGATDPETIRRCHSSCAYYVAKCPDIWPRIEPLLRELCPELQTMNSSPESPADEPRDASSRFDSVFAALGWDESFLDLAENPLEATATSSEAWILCIDDDDDFAEGLRLRFEQKGVRMLRANAGMAGYRHAFTSPAQAILLDFNMPDGQGDYVLRRLKENPVTRDIPVIVITGERSRPLERKMYNLGAAEYLNKPIDWETLWSAFSRVISKRQASRTPAFA